MASSSAAVAQLRELAPGPGAGGILALGAAALAECCVGLLRPNGVGGIGGGGDDAEAARSALDAMCAAGGEAVRRHADELTPLVVVRLGDGDVAHWAARPGTLGRACLMQIESMHLSQGGRDCCGQLRQEYYALLREKGECRRVLEDLMRENELKTKECHQAQTSLHELQMELMRKSMHVGSLAFAVEGQVKEKSRWCQLLKDLSEKFKALKSEHRILLKESEEYKKCLSDATQMTTTIHQYVNQYANLECEFKDLKEKFSGEAKERKDLYNKLIEIKGNIRVFCRCRPLNTAETAEGASMNK